MKMPKYLYYYLFVNDKRLKKNNLPSLQNLKNEYIGYILQVTKNNVSEASDILRVSPPTLYKKRKTQQIH
ncbi:MAG: hypothetical protein JXB23_13585 [Candidatus Aminicenantes bacterium]|nr:hypothetical protein [Candidatus Aminicenantes bacterium]